MYYVCIKKQIVSIMKAHYNLSKIMRNAWYLKRVQPSMTFSACLKKAWFNEKQALITSRIEGRTMVQKKTEYHPESLVIPADYYGVRGAYYGD